MGRLLPLVLAILVGVAFSTSCIIDNRPRGRNCPAGYAWQNGGCVKVHKKHHKGKQKHRKHRGR